MTDRILKSGLSFTASPLFRLAFSRIISAVLTLLVVSLIVFGCTQIIPGDIVTELLGRHASPERVAAYRAQLGLDQSPAVQYVNWLTGLVRGDFGHSLATGTPAWHILADPIRNTFILASITSVLLVSLSLVLGTIAGVRAGRPVDHIITMPTLITISIPEFVTGTIMIGVFGLWLALLPPVSLVPPGASPLAHPEILVMPIILLLSVSVGQTTRMIRAGVMEAINSDYVQMARLNGVSGNTLYRRYVLRNALVPSIQVLVFNIHWLFGGVVVTEVLFAYPGLGSTLIEAVSSRDVQIVQATCMLVATLTITLNLIADLLAIFLTPKLRTG